MLVKKNWKLKKLKYFYCMALNIVDFIYSDFKVYRFNKVYRFLVQDHLKYK